MKKGIYFFLVLFFLGLTGCRTAGLHHNLQEIDADEILVLLHQNGIEAKKLKEVSGQDVSWTVTVKDVDVARARQILISNNLPHRRELGLSGVYKDKGLIPTPDEQKARFLLALKGEIINSLRMIPGVIEADVVLNVPDESEFSDLDAVKKRPTASVVVRTRSEESAIQSMTESKVQRFVANSVPNLDPNDVTVIVTRTPTGASSTFGLPPVGSSPLNPAIPNEDFPNLKDESFAVGGAGDWVKILGVQVDRSSVARFKATFASLLLLLLVVSSLLLFNIVRTNRLKVQAGRGGVAQPALAAGSSPQGYLNEGSVGQGNLEGTFDMGNANQPRKQG